MREDKNRSTMRARGPLRKRTLERVAMALMALGALMRFQPFALGIYSYSFIVILVGTLMFIVVSHFAD
jgi:hypothetical protein